MNVESISFARATGGDTEGGGTRASDVASAPAAQTDRAQQPAARALQTNSVAQPPSALAGSTHAPAASAGVTAAPTAKPGAEQAPAAQPVRDRAFTASDSPCVAICSTLFDDICRGCGRTAMEVSNWVFMTEDEKKAVWTRILAQGYPRR